MWVAWVIHKSDHDCSQTLDSYKESYTIFGLVFFFLPFSWLTSAFWVSMNERDTKTSILQSFRFILLPFLWMCVCALLCDILVIFQTYNNFKRVSFALTAFMCFVLFGSFHFPCSVFVCSVAPPFRIYTFNRYSVCILNSRDLVIVTHTELINWRPTNGR